MKSTRVVFASFASLILVLLQAVHLSANASASEPALQRVHPAATGNPNAKVHIVEFLDPACEACRAFYPIVKQMMANNPEKIRLSVRLVGFHQGADYAVKALEASKLQGKFWPVLERLLASQDRWAINHRVKAELMWEQLKAPDLGLNLERLKQDMESFSVASYVAMDHQDAKTLKVKKTPEFFVNGKTLHQFGQEHLQRLVNDELAAAYK